MFKSTPGLSRILATLARRARGLGMTDTEWAGRAGVRKETLSRLRGRESCDLATLQSLAHVVGAEFGVLDSHVPGSTEDGHFPSTIDRDYEERLVELGASGDLDVQRWANLGPRFFMAGLAVMLASISNAARGELLGLAERLHPGASEVSVFDRWLARSPLRPTRFLPLVDEARRAA